MSERKKEIIESLKRKGVDPVKVEKEVMMLLRKGASSIQVREYLKKLLEGGEK